MEIPLKKSKLPRILLVLSIISYLQFLMPWMSGVTTVAQAATLGSKPRAFVVGASVNKVVFKPTEQVYTQTLPWGKVRYRTVDFPKQQMYWMYHADFSTTSARLLNLKVPVKGTGGTFTFFNTKFQLQSVPLSGNLPKAPGFITTSRATWYISYPRVLQNLPNHSVTENYTSLPIKVKKNKDGYDLLISFPRKTGTLGEIWTVRGTRQKLNWKDPLMLKAFSLLGNSNQDKWCWDGYYDLSPDSYVPGGKNVYWRIPDNYVARSLVNINPQNTLAKSLGWVMLHVAKSNQNSKGYWDSLPVSGWLWKKYGIGSGFYDTRFNTDFTNMLLQGYTSYKDANFLAAAERYAQWLSGYAGQQHLEIIEEGEEGWLIPDYYWPKKSNPTHTSLNHQLNEINFLYNLYVLTGKLSYKALADKLLNGIRYTSDFWGKPDGSLSYAYLYGVEVGEDYPYLTYNDMLVTQKYMRQLYGKPDADLGLLLANKKRQMDLHGVTGYNK